MHYKINFADFIKKFSRIFKILQKWKMLKKFWKFLSFINLLCVHVRLHKKFGSDQFSRFDVYWIQTNKQTSKVYMGYITHLIQMPNTLLSQSFHSHFILLLFRNTLFRDVNVFIFQKNDLLDMKRTTKNRKRNDRL